MADTLATGGMMSGLDPVMTVEDFAVGDRVFRQNDDTKEVVMGTVEQVGWDYLKISLDGTANSKHHLHIHIDLFQKVSGKPNYVRWWSKAFDIDRLEIGLRLSYLDQKNVRHHAVVVNCDDSFSFATLEFVNPREPSFTKSYLAGSRAEMELELRNFEAEEIAPEPLEAPREVETGLCWADLSEGMRIYEQDFDRIYFGTVLHSDPQKVSIKWDSGNTVHQVATPKLSLDDRLKVYKLPLPMDEIEVGSRISKIDHSGKRVYAKILSLKPKSFSYCFEHSATQELTVFVKSSEEMEYKMREWMLEA